MTQRPHVTIRPQRQPRSLNTPQTPHHAPYCGLGVPISSATSDPRVPLRLHECLGDGVAYAAVENVVAFLAKELAPPGWVQGTVNGGGTDDRWGVKERDCRRT
jgi:hypothetical protein